MSYKNDFIHYEFKVFLKILL